MKTKIEKMGHSYTSKSYVSADKREAEKFAKMFKGRVIELGKEFIILT